MEEVDPEFYFDCVQFEMPNKWVAPRILAFLAEAQVGDVGLGLIGTWRVSKAMGPE